MVYQKFYGICEHFFGWRCIACGEIVDKMILENQDDFGRSIMISRRGVWRKKEMGKDNSENTSERSIKNKNLSPEKYGMVVCPVCRSNGYVQNPKRQCCPKCRGFGFIKKEKEACNNEGARD